MGAISLGAVRLLPSTVPASVTAHQSSARALCLFWGAGLQPRPSRRMSTIQNLRKSLVRNWRPVCSLVGVLSLGPSLPLSPSPASCLRQGMGQSAAGQFFSGIAQSFLCSGNGPAVYLGRLIFSLSLAFPQFKLLSHVSSLQLPSGHSGPVLTLSNATHSSPFRPHLLVADAGVWGTFLLGVAFRHVICGFYLFFLPVRLLSEIRKLPPDPPVRGFPDVWKLPLL